MANECVSDSWEGKSIEDKVDGSMYQKKKNCSVLFGDSLKRNLLTFLNAKPDDLKRIEIFHRSYSF